MPSIVLSRVSFAHAGPVPLIRELSLRLEPGWTGVVGPNGSGKTTLLRLLAGELEPDGGEIRRQPAGLALRLCPQTLEALDPAVRAFAAAEDGAAARWRSALALEPSALARWPSLSPGERKRWQVAAALHAAPAALLLDEPTNHLDAASRAPLAAALAAFRGVGVLVSHDRALLDALSERTLRFDAGEIRLYRGGYAVARGTWEREERERLDAYRALQSERRQLRRRLGEARRKGAEAEAKRRRTMRRAGLDDIDTRKRLSLTRRRSAEARFGHEARKLRAALERSDARAEGFELHKARGRSLFVDFEPAPVPWLLRLEARELRAGERVLLRDLDLAVPRGGRIRVAGPNGAGKSTLLRALLARPLVAGDRILHLPQELPPEAGAERLAALRVAAPEAQGRVLSIVAALGVDPAALLASARPSPGEARKLVLAEGLARRVYALVLDEPTNHLDLPSVERLEAALADYPGALVLATHDEAFAERLTGEVCDLEGARVEVRREPGAAW
jgi:ATPase subunit of ABC transporter with duplicated ATPase domains